MKFIANRRNPVVEDAAANISGLCAPINILILLSALFLIDYRLFHQLLIKMGAAWILIHSAKIWISRERPKGNLETGITASFPSGHSATAFVLAGFLSQIFAAASPLIYSIAILVALSRLYLQSHYLSDVSAGSLIGILLTLAI